MGKYKYPDSEDKLTDLYINTMSDEKYWYESERNVLNIAISKIKTLQNGKKMLDLGCGFGRLFDKFIPYVENITALEPDTERYLVACDTANKISDEKIKVYNSDINSISSNEKFDIVLCSHIFQHLKQETTIKIFNKLSELIDTNGLLIITTTFTDLEHDIFTFEHLENNKHIITQVSGKEFEEAFNNNVLYTRLFSIKTIQKIADIYNFSLETVYGYHFKQIPKNLDVASSFDNDLNTKGKLSQAKDMLFILKKN